MSQFFEQSNVYNSYNSQVFLYVATNATVNGIGLNILWCPSDADIVGKRYPGTPGNDGWDDSAIPMTFTSYGGNSGPLYYYAGRDNVPQALVSQNQGIFEHAGRPFGVPGRNEPNGQVVTLGMITDGTSNTVLVGEHSYTRGSKDVYDTVGGVPNVHKWWDVNWWTTGMVGDGAYSALFPPNFFKTRLAADPMHATDCPNCYGPPNKFPSGSNFTCTATSFHPGGANFAMCDGSVRFIKDTVNSWNPFLIQFNGRNAAYTGVNGAIPPYGIYQALHTRSGGEVISADAL
jgi:prepilin-type processing-associated H-X9-DG protein